MPELSFSVYCGRCSNGLCRSVTVKGDTVTVDPCDKCLKDEREGGYDSGYDDGKDAGINEGYDSGFHDGQQSDKEAL